MFFGPQLVWQPKYEKRSLLSKYASIILLWLNEYDPVKVLSTYCRKKVRFFSLDKMQKPSAGVRCIQFLISCKMPNFIAFL